MAAIFISYRKQGEDKPSSLHLAEDLREALGHDAVFLDDHGLGLGRFDDQLLGEARSCQAMIAVIGPAWIAKIQELHDPQDWVRRELETALKREILMVPLLLDRARLPEERDLPPSLRGLLQYQTIEIYPRRRKEIVSELAEALSRALRLTKPQRVEPAALPNLTGSWTDTDGVSFRIEQRGTDVQIYMIDYSGRRVGQGTGTITGNHVLFSLRRPGYGQGSGTGTVSADGRQISGAIQYGHQRFGFSISKD
jgi:TIR domain